MKFVDRRSKWTVQRRALGGVGGLGEVYWSRWTGTVGGL